MTSASAIIKVQVTEEEVSAAEGDGPVNALTVHCGKHPGILSPADRMRLTDYKVRVLDTDRRAAKVRVPELPTEKRFGNGRGLHQYN